MPIAICRLQMSERQEADCNRHAAGARSTRFRGLCLLPFAHLQAGQLKENRMFLEPIQCGGELGDGRKCEESAKVIGTEFVYREELEEGRFEQILDEIHYTMECPKCGQWKWTATVH